MAYIQIRVTRASLRDIGIRREGLHAAQAADAAQQELEVAEGRGRLVLRHHVARKIDADIGQTTLGVSIAHDSRGGKGRLGHLVVVGHVEGLGGGGLEALEATPSHILDSEESTVREQDHVQ